MSNFLVNHNMSLLIVHIKHSNIISSPINCYTLLLLFEQNIGHTAIRLHTVHVSNMYVTFCPVQIYVLSYILLHFLTYCGEKKTTIGFKHII